MGEQDQPKDEQTSEQSSAEAGNPWTDAIPVSGHSIINRRSRWVSSWAAFCYVNSVQKDNSLKVRDSDKATSIALVLCCVLALISLIVPQLEQHRQSFVLAADVLVGLSLFMYVANRFGIISTFQPRQALLTWQLMVGSSLLGIFLTINLALIISFVISQNQVILAP